MPEQSRRPLPPSGPPLGGDREIVYRRRRGWFRRHAAPILTTVIVLGVVAAIVTAVLVTRGGDVAAGSDALSLASSSAPAPSSAAPSPTSSPTPSPTASSTEASGTVAAVLAPGSWTLRVQKDLDLTVVTTPATVFSRGRTSAEVKVGSTITVAGTIADGVITATTVTIEAKKKA